MTILDYDQYSLTFWWPLVWRDHFRDCYVCPLDELSLLFNPLTWTTCW